MLPAQGWMHAQFSMRCHNFSNNFINCANKQNTCVAMASYCGFIQASSLTSWESEDKANQTVPTSFLLIFVAFPAFFSQLHLFSCFSPLLSSFFVLLLLAQTSPRLLHQVLLSCSLVHHVHWYPTVVQ